MHIISSLPAKPTSKSNKHPLLLPHLPPLSLLHHSTVVSDPNNPTIHCILTKELSTSFLTQASLAKSPSVPTRCSCAAHNYEIPLGYMASPYLPATKQNSCGTPREFPSLPLTAFSSSLAYRRAAPIKRTAVEKQVNVHIIFLFGFLLALSVGSTIGASINTVSCSATCQCCYSPIRSVVSLQCKVVPF